MSRDGVLQRQLAVSVGVHENTVAKWTNGGQGPKFEHLFALAEALSIPVTELVSDVSVVLEQAPADADRLVEEVAIALRRTVSTVGAVTPDLLRVLADAEAYVRHEGKR